jgi:hypothetical protein
MLVAAWGSAGVLSNRSYTILEDLRVHVPKFPRDHVTSLGL